MRILFAVPYVPGPIRIRPYSLIRELVAMGHHVTVIAAVCNKEERANADVLRRMGIDVIGVPISRGRSLLNCMAALPRSVPLQAEYSWSRNFGQRLTELALGSKGKGFDVVHVEHLRGSRYGLHLKSQWEKRGMRLPIVWDSVDCISLLFRQASVQSRNWLDRMLLRFELGRTEKYEAFLLRQFKWTLVTSPIDRKSLLSLVPNQDPPVSEVLVVPNGVDVNHFHPDRNHPREPDTLVVSGKMSYHANVAMVVHLLKDIMPGVWARRPDAKVIVVGKDPPPIIRDFARNPRIRVTGTVDDIQPYLLSAAIAVAPVVYGVGIQNKVMEAMACATPVIATPAAIRALQTEPGRDLLVAEKPEDFAEAVVGLLENPFLRESIGRSGRAYIEKHCQWRNIAEGLADIYRAAIGEMKGRGHSY